MVLTGFAIFAVLLAAIGVYGVMAALVSQRTREIGIRVALGASRDHVLSLVLRPALVLAGAGIVAGLLGSVAAMRVLQSLVYGASVMQPLVFAGAAAFFLVVALAAAYLPARRALAVDQLAAFKAE